MPASATIFGLRPCTPRADSDYSSERRWNQARVHHVRTAEDDACRGRKRLAKVGENLGETRQYHRDENPNCHDTGGGDNDWIRERGADRRAHLSGRLHELRGAPNRGTDSTTGFARLRDPDYKSGYDYRRRRERSCDVLAFTDRLSNVRQSRPPPSWRELVERMQSTRDRQARLEQISQYAQSEREIGDRQRITPSESVAV
jgi:hypothetical protein